MSKKKSTAEPTEYPKGKVVQVGGKGKAANAAASKKNKSKKPSTAKKTAKPSAREASNRIKRYRLVDEA